MPSSTDPVADALADVARCLAALRLRWFLFGAQAAILYGVARLSADIDITVDLGARTSRELVAALEAGGFELRVRDAGGFVETTRMLPFVHGASRMPLDVVLAGPGLEEQFFAGAREREIAGTRVPVVAGSRPPPRTPSASYVPPPGAVRSPRCARLVSLTPSSV